MATFFTLEGPLRQINEITDHEPCIAMAQDFRHADLDNDTLLTENEFLSAFPIIIAMRAAIRPDL